MTETRKNQSEEWTYFTLLFMYFITVNKYRFCISVIGYINVQIIGIKHMRSHVKHMYIPMWNTSIFPCETHGTFLCETAGITCEIHVYSHVNYMVYSHVKHKYIPMWNPWDHMWNTCIFPCELYGIFSCERRVIFPRETHVITWGKHVKFMWFICTTSTQNELFQFSRL